MPSPIRSFATNTVSSASSITINLPAGTLKGDMLIAAIGVLGGSTITLTPPTGWTNLRQINYGTSGSRSGYVYYKQAGSSEPSSYTWSFNSLTGAAAYIASVIDSDVPEVSQAQGGISSTASAADITTVSANDTVLIGYFATGSTTITPAAGQSDLDSGEGGSIGTPVVVAYFTQATAGSIGSVTASLSQSVPWGTIVLGIPPAAVSCVMSGTGTFTPIASGQAKLSGVGTIHAIPTGDGKVTFTGAGTVTAKPEGVSSLTLEGRGNLVASPDTSKCVMSGLGTMYTPLPPSCYFIGKSNFTPIASGQTSWHGVGGMTAKVTAHDSIAFGGRGSLIAKTVGYGKCVMSGSGKFAIVNPDVFRGVGNMVAIPSTSKAILSGHGSLTAIADTAKCVMSGSGGLTGNVTAHDKVVFSGLGTLNPIPDTTKLVLSGKGNFVAGPCHNPIVMRGTGGFTVKTGTEAYKAKATLSGSGTLKASPSTSKLVTSGKGGMKATALAVYKGTATLAGTGHWTGKGSGAGILKLQGQGGKVLAGTGTSKASLSGSGNLLVRPSAKVVMSGSGNKVMLASGTSKLIVSGSGKFNPIASGKATLSGSGSLLINPGAKATFSARGSFTPIASGRALLQGKGNSRLIGSGATKSILVVQRGFR